MTHGLDNALWYLGRGTGVTALLMFTFTVTLGIVTRSGRSLAGLGRFGAADLHRTASLAGLMLVATHVVALLFDPYAQLRILDLVLPFAGRYRPVWLGFGTLALDLLVVLVISSLLRHRIGPRLFRALHWTAYAMWPFAMTHLLGIGTDRATLWLRGLAGACALVVLLALLWRASSGYAERGRQRIPRKVPVR